MVHSKALEGICARRNGIIGGSWKEARLEGGTVYAGNSLQAYSDISLN